MPLIDGKEVLTVKRDGKIFVLECGCNSRWVVNKTVLESEFPDGYSCSRCSYTPWIILPKGGR